MNLFNNVPAKLLFLFFPPNLVLNINNTELDKQTNTTQTQTQAQLSQVPIFGNCL